MSNPLKTTPKLLFGLLALMAICVVLICTLRTIPNETGYNDPRFPPGTLMSAPAGSDRHTPAMLAAAGTYGALVVLIAGSFMALGLNFKSSEGRGRVWLLLTTSLYAATLACVVVVYGMTLNDSEQTYVLGFPISVAIMLYAMSLAAPTLLVILYMAKYNQWICDPQDMQRFETLLQQRRVTRTEADA